MYIQNFKAYIDNNIVQWVVNGRIYKKEFVRFKKNPLLSDLVSRRKTA